MDQFPHYASNGLIKSDKGKSFCKSWLRLSTSAVDPTLYPSPLAIHAPTVLEGKGIDSRLIEIFQPARREKSMSRDELYQWTRQIKAVFRELGVWPAISLALYSYGVVVTRGSAPSRVAEKLSRVGKADSVQRRLERWLANERIDWQACCRVWTSWVMACWQGEQLFLLVDETKLGQPLSAPNAWPDGQVALIGRLLSWVAASIPDGYTPMVQADRGLVLRPL